MDDFCHLYRDVRVGASGGDAHCLQRWLAKAGHLSSATSPSGTFDDATSLAVAKWQKANKWNASGTIDEATRKAYGEVRFRESIRSIITNKLTRSLLYRDTASRRARAED